MALISAIQGQNGRIYLLTQALLGCALVFAATGNLIGERSAAVGWALTLCIVALAFGMAALSYLRRSLQHKLHQASTVEASRQRIIESDALTGAMSRGHFLAELGLLLGPALQPNKATLLLVDLDYFKQLNDSMGHRLGDTALRHLVRSAHELFPGALIGRLGGDEFAIALRSDERSAIITVANRLIEALRRGIEHDGNTIPLSASIGMALAPIHANDTEELIHRADLALYDSKANGRGRVTVFEDAFVTEIRRRRYLERELRAALFMNELELHYQPIVDRDGRRTGVEGLVRWRHPVRGLISPAEFIPVAERSTLIDQVGAWVFRRACQDAHHFDGQRVCINVSGEQLKRNEIVQMVQRTLTETGRDASQFVLEITETAAMSCTPEVLERLHRLRDMGFRIALDDFGTGHCGFNYLQSLPIDTIKIDRSYVRDISRQGIAQIFIAALVQIARVRGLTIVAEGVENDEEFILARAAGCTRFQGYHFGRAQPLAQLRQGSPAPQLARSA